MEGRAVLVTAPSVEPVTIDEVKAQLRISGTAEDSLLTGLIAAGRRKVETYLNRSLITQTWDVFFDDWECEFKIPYPNLQTVTTVKYYDESGTLQTLASSNYYVVTSAEPGLIKQAYGVTYPTLMYDRPDGVQIRVVCGYGLAVAVPADIKQAILLTIGDLYAHRENIQYGSLMVMLKLAQEMLHPYRVYHF